MSLNQVRVKAVVRGKSGRREWFIAVHKKSNKMSCPELCKGHHWYDKLSFNGRRKLKSRFPAFVAPLELGGGHHSVSQREACLTNFILQNKGSHGQTQSVNSIVNMRGPRKAGLRGQRWLGRGGLIPGQRGREHRQISQAPAPPQLLTLHELPTRTSVLGLTE